MKAFRQLRLEAVVSTWTVTVQKPVNKLKKGDKQVVKARSGFEAINKAMKLWKDPALKAAPASAFKITKESLDEAKKLGSRVKITKGRFKGEEGVIRQMDNDKFKGADKSFDIDLDNGKEANGVPGKDIKIVKESVDEALVEENANHRGKQKIAKDGTVLNIPGKKGGLTAYNIKPRLSGGKLEFFTTDNEGAIKVMSVKELAKVLS